MSIDDFVASVGSSPMHWLYVSENPALSGIDWPTGTRNLGKSLPVNFYWVAENYMSIDASVTIYIYTLAEILIALFAYAFFFKTALKTNSWCLTFFFSVAVVLCSFQAMNLARFGYPFHFGLYYSLAGAARIVAIAFVLSGRPWSAMTALTLSVTTHPLIGGVGILAVSGVIILRGIAEIKRYLVPALIAASVTFLWIWVSFSGSTTSSGEIPLEYWLNFTQKFNSHWYPQELGIFSTGVESIRRLLPLVSLSILFFIFELSDRHGFHNQRRREIRLIALTLVALTVAGVIVSVVSNTPFLIKLALHRSSDLLAVVCFAAVLPRLFEVFEKSGSKRISLVALLVIVSVFAEYRVFGFPLFLTLLLTLPLLLAALKCLKAPHNVLIVALWCAGAAVFAFYSLTPLITSHSDFRRILERSYLSDFYLLTSGIACVILSLYLADLFSTRLFRFGILTLAVIATLGNHSRRLERYESPRTEALKETQIWARENTPADALFMLDPGKNDAWRDVARRASFGTANEWLHKAWLYDSDAQLFREGIRRAALLDLDFKDALSTSRKDLGVTVSENYNRAPSGWLNRLAEDEGITFFVFEKKNVQSLHPESWIAFENEHYFVLTPN